MTQIVHARSAEIYTSPHLRESVLLAASVYGQGGCRYVTGRAEIRGEALLERQEHRNYREMVATYRLMAAVHRAEPEAYYQKHPQMIPAPVTIHHRDGATVLVSTVESPCQRFWVSRHDLHETRRRS